MNADIIYVIDSGYVQEKGQFKNLKRYKGYVDRESYDENESPTKSNVVQKI
jgi:hypothetical protein